MQSRQNGPKIRPARLNKVMANAFAATRIYLAMKIFEKKRKNLQVQESFETFKTESRGECPKLVFVLE